MFVMGCQFLFGKCTSFSDVFHVRNFRMSHRSSILLSVSSCRSQCKVHDLVQLASLETWWKKRPTSSIWPSLPWQYKHLKKLAEFPASHASLPNWKPYLLWELGMFGAFWLLLHLQTLGRALLFDDVWRHFWKSSVSQLLGRIYA